jgi:hypothetical protein
MAEKEISIDELSSPVRIEDMSSSPKTEGPSSVGKPDSSMPLEKEVSSLSSPLVSSVAPFTASDALKESALGAAYGFSKTAPAVSGAAMGMRLGTPLGPYGMLGGAIVGGAAGYMGGSELQKLIPGLSREDLAPYREGGVTFGESIGFAPLAFGLPLMTGNRVSRFFSGIGESARRNPLAFTAAETSSALGAGTGTVLAETYFPGELGPRLAAETGGGLFMPGRLFINATTTVADAARAMKGSTTSGARESRAGDRLRTIIEENGEDWEAIARALERPSPPGVKPTSAQKLGVEMPRGSVTLSALETTLARGNAKFGAETLDQGLLAMRGYQALIRKLEEVGNPESLRKAAELRNDWFNNLLEGRLALADAESADKIRRISRDTPQARAQIGEIVKDETVLALRDARDYEKQLWQEAYRDSFKVTRAGEVVARTLKPKNTLRTYLSVVAEKTPEFRGEISAPLRAVMARLGASEDAIRTYRNGMATREFLSTGEMPQSVLRKMTGRETTVSDLISIRSDLLGLARDAAGKGEVSNASLYGKLAESVLDDMGSLNTAGYDRARMFSRSLNDAFTRTFARDVNAAVKSGAEKIPAEVLVTRAFGRDADTVALRMNDIENAVGLLRREYDEVVKNFGAGNRRAQELSPLADLADSRVASIRDAQERVLRLAAAKSVDPATGRLNTTALSKFVNDNRSMLDRFGVTADLENATQAENLFRAINASTSKINKTIRDQTVFAQLLKYENPTSVVADAVNSAKPSKNFNKLVKFAQLGGPDAVNGLKSSVLDYAYTKAGGEAGFSVKEFERRLFEPIGPGKPSLIAMLRDNGVMSFSEVKDLRRLITPMKRVESAMGNRKLLEEVLTGADAASELGLRIAGAKMGSALNEAAGGGGGSLIAASAGSKAMRQIFDKMPNIMTRSIIENAMKDPQLMALLLRKGQTEKERIRIARSLHGYLGAAGLNFATAYFEEPPPPPEENRPRGTPMTMLNRQYPSTKGVPSLSTTGQQPAAPGPQSAAPGPQSAAPGTARAQLAALFPNDTLSGLISAQNAGQMPQ